MASTRLDAIDYYLVLEVSPSSTLETIKSNYKRLALDRHPDKNPENPDAKAAFQLLSEAYETLKDDQLRATYDAKYVRFEEKSSQQRLSEWRAFHSVQSDKILQAERLIKTLTTQIQYLEYEETLGLQWEGQEKPKKKSAWRVGIPFGSVLSANARKQEEEEEENSRLQRDLRKQETTAELLSEQRELRRLRDEMAQRRQVLMMALKEDEARAQGISLQELDARKTLQERRAREVQQANYRAWEAKRMERQMQEMASNRGIYSRRW